MSFMIPDIICAETLPPTSSEWIQSGFSPDEYTLMDRGHQILSIGSDTLVTGISLEALCLETWFLYIAWRSGSGADTPLDDPLMNGVTWIPASNPRLELFLRCWTGKWAYGIGGKVGGVHFIGEVDQVSMHGTRRVFWRPIRG
jgi:hypothetical protein